MTHHIPALQVCPAWTCDTLVPPSYATASKHLRRGWAVCNTNLSLSTVDLTICIGYKSSESGVEGGLMKTQSAQEFSCLGHNCEPLTVSKLWSLLAISTGLMLSTTARDPGSARLNDLEVPTPGGTFAGEGLPGKVTWARSNIRGDDLWMDLGRG
jgi:hypothetical protein